MPASVEILAILGAATWLAAWMLPLPKRVTARAVTACSAMLAIGGVALATGVALFFAGAFTPAVVLASVAFLTWTVMFWIARNYEIPGSDGSDDGGGGGGGSPVHPEPPRKPSGEWIDWDRFDLERADWERAAQRS